MLPGLRLGSCFDFADVLQLSDLLADVAGVRAINFFEVPGLDAFALYAQPRDDFVACALRTCEYLQHMECSFCRRLQPLIVLQIHALLNC